MSAPVTDVVARRYNDQHLVDTLTARARAPTDYVHQVVRPLIERMGLGSIAVDELNNLVLHIGPPAMPPRLFVMAYTTAQRGNYTDPALEGRVMNGRAYGLDAISRRSMRTRFSRCWETDDG